MPIAPLKSALIAAALGIVSVAPLSSAPAHAAADASEEPTVLVVQSRSVSSAEKMPIQQILCPPHAPYLANLSLTPSVPGTPKGMRIHGSPAMSFVELPSLRTDAQRRVIGWDSRGIVRNDAEDEPRRITIEAWCTADIEDGYTL